jgi:hypothetical protein
MSKRLAVFFAFFFVFSALYGQTSTGIVSQLDDAVKTLAADIRKKIPAGEYSHIVPGQWIYRSSVPLLGLYWAAQLSGELANIPGRDFGLETGISGLTNWIVSGEIVEIPGAIRVYTRLIRHGSREIEASFHADFDLNEDLAEMLAGGESDRNGDSRSRLIARDGYEPDSPQFLPDVDIAAGSDGPVISRTIHAANDEDFFLLTMDTGRNGVLVMETTGDTDTCMELYDRDSQEKLAENDDGGSGVNARIRHDVQAGVNAFFVKVRGYSGDTGNYGFHAWFDEAAAPDEYDPDSPENPLAADISAGSDGPVISRTIHAANDEDFFLLAPEKDGMLNMETTGELDTYMELYNAGSRVKLGDDDDSGSDVNARIRYGVQAGSRYVVKVRGYSGDTGNYGFRAWLVEAAPDEYENDNDFDSAGEITLGTAQRHTFTTGNDTDWVKFSISRDGRYTIRARGVNSTRLDTYIELYDEDHNTIDRNDDGGETYDSLLSVRLRAGTYYLKAGCLDEDPDEPYTIIVESAD